MVCLGVLTLEPCRHHPLLTWLLSRRGQNRSEQGWIGTRIYMWSPVKTKFRHELASKQSLDNVYIHRIYCSIISQWKRLHHGRFLPMWPAAIRGRKSRDLVASEPDAWLWPFCRQRFTECCGSNIPPMLNHRAAKLDTRGVRRKSPYFVSGFNINIH